MTCLAGAPHSGEIADGQQQGEGTKQQVKAPHAPHVEDGGLLGQLVAELGGHLREVRDARWGRRGAPHGDGDTGDRRHDKHLDDGDLAEQAAISGVGLHLRNDPRPVDPPEDTEDDHADGLGHDD